MPPVVQLDTLGEFVDLTSLEKQGSGPIAPPSGAPVATVG